jgi:hypothetical protein
VFIISLCFSRELSIEFPRNNKTRWSKKGGKMKFLVISKPKHLVPPEVMVGVLDGIGPWQSKYAGKIEQVWGFAGIAGGGGIINVNSLEELDAVMAELPVAPISEVEIFPLVDLDASLQRAKQAMQAMASGS